MGQQPQDSPRRSSDKILWSQIYRTMKDTIKSQQSQIEALINDREFLEDYVHLQHEQWCRRTRFLESHIAQMKEEQVKTRLVEDARMSVFVGFKESEALRYKMQLDLAESDLEDFRSCMEAESIEMGELKEKLKSFGVAENADYSNNVSGPSGNLKGRDQSVVSFKKEIKKLKHAHRELSSRKDAEVSALLAEKDFVWNQFKMMENDYIALLKRKRAEANLDKKATENLQNSVEKLLFSINEKDEIIAKLEAERCIIQENSSVKSKYDRKSQNGPGTVRESESGSRKRYLDSCDASTRIKRRSSRRVTFETPAPNNVHMLHQGLIGQRGGTPSLTTLQSPLFHSDFKVPKLKRSARLEP